MVQILKKRNTAAGFSKGTQLFEFSIMVEGKFFLLLFLSYCHQFNQFSIFNLNSHKHFYSVEKKNRIHLNIIYNLHIEDDK